VATRRQSRRALGRARYAPKSSLGYDGLADGIVHPAHIGYRGPTGHRMITFAMELTVSTKRKRNNGDPRKGHPGKDELDMIHPGMRVLPPRRRRRQSGTGEAVGYPNPMRANYSTSCTSGQYMRLAGAKGLVT
jgi:hypothetical protein